MVLSLTPFNKEVDNMSYEKFITDFLNIKPSELSKISTSTQSDGSIFVKIKLVQKVTSCPFCHNYIKVHDYYDRKLTHSTFSNKKCTIIYSQRRYRCPQCELTFREGNPFIDSSEHITYKTKFNILKELKYPEATYTSVAKRYNVSANKVIRIFEKHVDIPRKKLPAILSIDEHYFPASDYKAKYCCLLMDFSTGIMLDVLPDRKKSYLVNYFSTIKADTFNYVTKTSELDNVRYVSIDMYDVYRDIAKTYFPKAKICADSFHVTEHLTKAFRSVRLNARRSTENPVLKYLLTRFKNVFAHKYQSKLDNEPKYNKKLGQYINYRGIRDLLFESFPVLKTAFELKEYYINLNNKTTIENASDKIDEAIDIFYNCGIEEYSEFHGLLVNWRNEIINSFTVIDETRINNSFMESKNRIVAKLIYNANGFRNFKRTRNRILYCLNWNDSFKL